MTKDKSKKYIVPTTLIIAIIIGLLILLPSFIYNEFEYRFRKEFSNAFELSVETDELVEQRIYGFVNSLISDEEHRELGERIESNLVKMQDHLTQGASIMENQGTIPFLPSKYHEYHVGKIDAVNEYSRLAGEFLQKKKNDHMLTNTTILIMRLDEALRDISNPSWWDTANSLPYEIAYINSNNRQLIENDFITEDHFNAMKRATDLYQFMYEQSQIISKNNSWDDFDMDTFIALSKARSDLDFASVSYESLTISKHVADEYQEKVIANDAELEKWANYYDGGRLAFDPVSSVLAKIFPTVYPHNFNPNKPSPIIPRMVNPDLVSLVSSTISKDL
jgi:hypothetical protein